MSSTEESTRECQEKIKGVLMMQQVVRILGEVDLINFRTREELRDDSRLTQAGSSTPFIIDSNKENVSPLNSAPSGLLQRFRDSADSLLSLIKPDHEYIHENRPEIPARTGVSALSRIELVGRNQVLEMEVQRLRLIMSTLEMEGQSVKRTICTRAANKRRSATPSSHALKEKSIKYQVPRPGSLGHQLDPADGLRKEIDILIRDKNRLEIEVTDLRRERAFVADIVDQVRLDYQERVDSLKRIIDEKDKQLRLLDMIDERFKQEAYCQATVSNSI
jgi:regulator of replication initiation timing